MTIALRHRDVFGVIATIGGPLNVRYNNIQGVYGDDFDPATYRARTAYEPEMIIAYYYLGIVRRAAPGSFSSRSSATGLIVSDKVTRDNPADVLAATDIRPGELIHVNYPSDDNYDFNAQDQSFLWLAGRRGLAVDVKVVPGAQHNLAYIEREVPSTCQWLANHLLPAVRR